MGSCDSLQFAIAYSIFASQDSIPQAWLNKANNCGLLKQAAICHHFLNPARAAFSAMPVTLCEGLVLAMLICGH